MRVRVRYSGRVQGVGFRATTCDIARRFGAVGWVRNEEDGTVLAEVQGEPHTVAAMLDEIARVFGRNLRGTDRAEIHDAPGESGFEVRR